MKKRTWDFFVDTGGTFTDCLARSEDGVFFRAKVLSRGTLSARIERIVSANEVKLKGCPDWPEGFVPGMKVRFSGLDDFHPKIIGWRPASLLLSFDRKLPEKLKNSQALEVLTTWEAPVLGLRLILARVGLKQSQVRVRMRLATTRCTNALLEKTGERPVLFVTAGFPDLLEIGDQRRLGLFDLIPRKRKPLSERVVEVEERLDRRGRALKSPDLRTIRSLARDLVAAGYRCAAVSFIHSYLNPVHERKVAKTLREAGFERVIESSSLSGLIKWLPRCESSVVEAYLAEILEAYLDRVQGEIGEDGELLISTSSGGLINRSQYRAIDSLLSGPAAGVVGASTIAESLGFAASINLDMGGTSTDVSRYSGHFSYQPSHRIGDAKVSGLAMKLETVAAGGGSVCRVERGLLRVGPRSAGAYPGPACYGFGGPLCLTDVNLLMGRLDPSLFATPIIRSEAERRLEEMAEESNRSPEDLLQGFLAIADDSMANAIRKISIEEGYDPGDHALVAFGGAGGQHACGVASRLGMTVVLSPADSGLLSAYGLSKARVERVVERSFLGPIEAGSVKKAESAMIEEGQASVSEVGETGEVIRKTALVRFRGQDSTLEIEYDEPEDLQELHRAKFSQVFGYYPDQKDLEIHSLRMRVAGNHPENRSESFAENGAPPVSSHTNGFVNRSSLLAGARIAGPCLVVDDYGTLWIEEGWTGSMGDSGTLRLQRDASSERKRMPETVRRELFASKFLCLAEEMGKQLERTALSVNVRERLDFSCALLDSRGYLVANAPHIPVHLGAMGLFARRMIEKFPRLSRGDVLLSNHPAFGGSHLPDLSVLAPVYGDSRKPVAFLANRAHHADIGGISPGSMPGGADSLEAEGVVLHPQFLFENNRSRFEAVRRILSTSQYPCRQVDENLADLSAQVASLRAGIQVMEELLEIHGEPEIIAQMESLRRESRESCLHFLKSFEGKKLTGEQFLDDGDKICLSVTVDRERAVFDFSGTAPVRRDNLNATEAIVCSVICYCLRVLIGSHLPLNEGLLEPVEVIVPKGCLLNPDYKAKENYPGVAGGNVEISQRLTDLILSSVFKVAACSQGTMNNFTFGNLSYSHYETLGGGSGAKIGQDGTSAVQVHMTNTAITDPEILEFSFPVRLLAYKRRKDSGGNGAWKGGEGLEREYLFEEAAHFSFLSQRRAKGPDGLNGGLQGMPGEQILYRREGGMVSLSGSCSGMANEGDRILVRTPGGGGAGKPLPLA